MAMFSSTLDPTVAAASDTPDKGARKKLLAAGRKAASPSDWCTPAEVGSIPSVYLHSWHWILGGALVIACSALLTAGCGSRAVGRTRPTASGPTASTAPPPCNDSSPRQPEMLRALPIERVLLQYPPPDALALPEGSNRRVELVGYNTGLDRALIRTEHQWANTFRLDIEVTWEALQLPAGQSLGAERWAGSFGIHPNTLDRPPTLDGASWQSLLHIAETAGVALRKLQRTHRFAATSSDLFYLRDERRVVNRAGRTIAELNRLQPRFPSFAPRGTSLWFACDGDSEENTAEQAANGDAICILETTNGGISHHDLHRTSTRVVDLVTLGPSDSLLLTHHMGGLSEEACVERWTSDGAHRTLACWTGFFAFEANRHRFLGPVVDGSVMLVLTDDSSESERIASIDVELGDVLSELLIPATESYGGARLGANVAVLYGRTNHRVTFANLADGVVRVFAPENDAGPTGEWANGFVLVSDDGEQRLLALHASDNGDGCSTTGTTPGCRTEARIVELAMEPLFAPCAAPAASRHAN